MFSHFRIPLIAMTVVAALWALWAFAPATTQADDYWNGYWGWYNDDYRPYYHRQHHRYYDNRYYNDWNYNRSYRGYYYQPDYHHGYYYNPHSLRRPHNSLQLGPLHLDWR